MVICVSGEWLGVALGLVMEQAEGGGTLTCSQGGSASTPTP